MKIEFSNDDYQWNTSDFLKAGGLALGAARLYGTFSTDKALDQQLKRLQIAQMKKQLGDSYTDSDYSSNIGRMGQVGSSIALQRLADDSMLEKIKDRFLTNLQKGPSHAIRRKWRL